MPKIREGKQLAHSETESEWSDLRKLAPAGLALNLGQLLPGPRLRMGSDWLSYKAKSSALGC